MRSSPEGPCSYRPDSDFITVRSAASTTASATSPRRPRRFPGNLLNGDCLTAVPACFGGAFVTMLNPQGSAIIYSYLLTADDNEFGYNTGSVGSCLRGWRR